MHPSPKVKRKVGHGGTLDPGATGLLVIACDDDTKQLTDLLVGSKRYRATFTWGRMTDTRDAYPRSYDTRCEPSYDSHNTIQGHYVDTKIIQKPNDQAISDWIIKRIGTQILTLPPFRASKQQGQALYKIARKKQFDPTQIMDTKEVTINTMTMIEYCYPSLTLECEVGGGTYIRSLAWDLYQYFGIPCIMQSLHRCAVYTPYGWITPYEQGIRIDLPKLGYTVRDPHQ